MHLLRIRQTYEYKFSFTCGINTDAVNICPPFQQLPNALRDPKEERAVKHLTIATFQLRRLTMNQHQFAITQIHTNSPASRKIYLPDPGRYQMIPTKTLNYPK